MTKEIVEYCPHCDADTLHVRVEDDVYEHAIECQECHTVWEAVAPELLEEGIEEDDDTDK